MGERCGCGHAADDHYGFEGACDECRCDSYLPLSIADNEATFDADHLPTSKVFPHRDNHTKSITSLVGVEVGDKFMRPCAIAGLVEVTCEKVMVRQCVIGGLRYRIKDAEHIGGHGGRDVYGSSPVLMNLDVAELEAARREKAIDEARRRFAREPRLWLTLLPDEAIEAVLRIVEAAEKKVT